VQRSYTTQSDDEKGKARRRWEESCGTHGRLESPADVIVNDATDASLFLLLHAHRTGHCLLLDLFFSLVLSLSLACSILTPLSPFIFCFPFQLDLRISDSFLFVRIC
jgi:hypothetical protein